MPLEYQSSEKSKCENGYTTYTLFRGVTHGTLPNLSPRILIDFEFLYILSAKIRT